MIATTRSAPLQRAFRVLDLVAESASGLTIAQISNRARLPTATTYRLVGALLAEGYLERSGQGGACRIGARLKRLSTQGLFGSGTADAVRPMLQQIADTVDAVSYLTRRNGLRVDAVAQALPTRTHSTIVLPGVDIPLHATSSGKVLMAWLDLAGRRDLLSQPLTRYRPATITAPAELEAHLRNVRRRGYATCRDEFDRGVFSLSVPVRSSRGIVALALGVVGFEHSLLSSWPEHSLKTLLLGVAGQIERGLAGKRI